MYKLRSLSLKLEQIGQSTKNRKELEQMQKVISVTQKHINKGHREQRDSCPVALALLGNGFDSVSVDEFSIDGRHSDEGDTGFVSFESPRSVARFVRKFDRLGKKAVKPFNFKLNIEK